VVSFLNISKKEKSIIFIVIAVLSFPITYGLNYTLFRFVFPFFCMVFLRQIEHKTKTNFILSILLPLLVVLTSPEMGIAFYVSYSVYLGIAYYFSRKTIGLVKLVAIVLSLIFSFFCLPDMFLSVLGFGSGSFNWPFVLSLALVLFFVGIFIVAWGIGIQLRGIKTHLFPLSFTLLAFSLLPAALGRCDPGHIFFNGMFIFILAHTIIRTYSRKLCYFAGTTSIIIIAVSLFYYPVKNYIPTYASSWVGNYGLPDKVPAWIVSLGRVYGLDVEGKMQNRKLKIKFNYNDSFANIDNITMPFADNDIYISLQKSQKYISLYYKNPGHIGSKHAFEKNLNDMKEKNIKYLLLAEGWEEQNQPAGYGIIDPLFISKYTFPIKRNGNILFDPLIEYIKYNYTHVDDIGAYQLFLKKGTET
jgi:hypothetical protein